MKKEKTLLACAVAASLGMTGISVQAASIAIGDMRITGGAWAMGIFTPILNPFTQTSGANIVAGYIAPTWDLNTAQTSAAPGAIMAFDFNGAGTWVNVYSASFAVQPGVAGGGPVPNGTMDDAGGAMTVDLTALLINWNGTDFDGGGIATGTTSNCVAGSCDFIVNWNALIVSGPSDGTPQTWQVTGTVSAVPVPAAVWLMGSGLAGLVGIARRRPRRA